MLRSSSVTVLWCCQSIANFTRTFIGNKLKTLKLFIQKIRLKFLVESNFNKKKPVFLKHLCPNFFFNHRHFYSFVNQLTSSCCRTRIFKLFLYKTDVFLEAKTRYIFKSFLHPVLFCPIYASSNRYSIFNCF